MTSPLQEYLASATGTPADQWTETFQSQPSPYGTLFYLCETPDGRILEVAQNTKAAYFILSDSDDLTLDQAAHRAYSRMEFPPARAFSLDELATARQLLDYCVEHGVKKTLQHPLYASAAHAIPGLFVFQIPNDVFENQLVRSDQVFLHSPMASSGGQSDGLYIQISPAGRKDNDFYDAASYLLEKNFLPEHVIFSGDYLNWIISIPATTTVLEFYEAMTQRGFLYDPIGTHSGIQSQCLFASQLRTHEEQKWLNVELGASSTAGRPPSKPRL